MSSRSAVSLVGLALLGMLVGGCSSSARSRHTMLADTLLAECAVGKRPGYLVPGDDRRPALLVGCARLGVSRKRADFSLNLGRIDGEVHLCVNLAYTGRGRPGFYIPSICRLDPPPARFAVRDVAWPRQGVRGYALVIWGTAPPATAAVKARFGRRAAAAAVFTVPTKWSRRFRRAAFQPLHS